MTKLNPKTIAKPKPPKTKLVTKKAQLIKLLRTKTGADIKTLSEKLSWQQHTTRAEMSGLRKAGYEVVGEQPSTGGKSKFRILSVPSAPQVASVEAATNGA